MKISNGVIDNLNNIHIMEPPRCTWNDLVAENYGIEVSGTVEQIENSLIGSVSKSRWALSSSLQTINSCDIDECKRNHESKLEALGSKVRAL